MFSKMMAALRLEAEKVSASNSKMLAHSRLNGWDLEKQVSGQAKQEKVMIAGGALSMGGLLGLIGVAMANQAAGGLAVGATGLVGSSMLASASTMLAGLGSVALGSAILPVATVVTLGAAVAGVGVFAISRMMSVDYEKGLKVREAVEDRDLDSLSKIGSQNVGVSDWLKGAKNFVTNSLRDTFSTSKNKTLGRVSVVENGMDAAEKYEMEDLFGDTFEESAKGKQKIVEKIGVDIWEKHGVVVTDKTLHDCLGATRGNSTAYGKILAVDLKSGLVVQSIGRGQATVHNLKDFQRVPLVGQDVSISYKGGKMQGAKEQGNEQDSRTSVGR